jgi:hypothetical protein
MTPAEALAAATTPQEAAAASAALLAEVDLLIARAQADAAVQLGHGTGLWWRPRRRSPIRRWLRPATLSVRPG